MDSRIPPSTEQQRISELEHKAKQYDDVVAALGVCDGGRYRADTISSVMAALAAKDAEIERLKHRVRAALADILCDREEFRAIQGRAEAAERQVAELKREIGERDTAIDRLKARVEITESTEDAALQEAILCGREAERLKWSKEVAALRAQLQEAQKDTERLLVALGNELHCATCAGTGEMSWSCPGCDESGYPQKSCGACHGTGTEGPYECAECDGEKLSARHGDSIALYRSFVEDAARSEGGSTKGTAHSADAEGARNAADLGGDSREER